jgi:hypothetical protein
MSIKQQALQLSCPFCRVGPGQPCESAKRARGHLPITPTRQPISGVHQARMSLAYRLSRARIQEVVAL